MIPEFRWILPNALAGSAQPGLFTSVEEDMDRLDRLGIKVIVTLTEKPLAGLDPDRFEVIHFPIDDMGIPTPRSASGLCDEVMARLEQNRPVLMHCKGGAGRTGLMLACCLVRLGRAPETAVREVRTVNNAYIQTSTQERFVHHFSEFLRQS